MNAYLTKRNADHHTPNRLHALRGYAREADRLNRLPPYTTAELWLMLVAGILALGIVLGVPEQIAELIK